MCGTGGQIARDPTGFYPGPAEIKARDPSYYPKCVTKPGPIAAHVAVALSSNDAHVTWGPRKQNAGDVRSSRDVSGTRGSKVCARAQHPGPYLPASGLVGTGSLSRAANRRFASLRMNSRLQTRSSGPGCQSWSLVRPSGPWGGPWKQLHCRRLLGPQKAKRWHRCRRHRPNRKSGTPW